MSKRSGIFWHNPLKNNMLEMGGKLDAAITALMAYEANRSEEYMRVNAPWQDQTGNARNGLFARPTRNEVEAGTRNNKGQFINAGLHYGILLYHTMPYGIWLEVRWSGRYAIIMPTVETKAPDVMSGTNKILARLGLGGLAV